MIFFGDAISVRSFIDSAYPDKSVKLVSYIQKVASQCLKMESMRD